MALFHRPTVSSAVKIVPPSGEVEKPLSRPSPSKKDSTQRQCRNILIYGSCKFQDKGCIYYHPPQRQDASDSTTAESAPSALPAESVNAPVFVPKSSTPVLSAAVAHPVEPQDPPGTTFALDYDEEHDPYDPFSYPYSNGHDYSQTVSDVTSQMQALDTHDYDHDSSSQHHQFLPTNYDPPSLNYYPTDTTFVRQPLNYHLYTHSIPDSFSHNHFISDSIREELQRRSETIYTTPAPGLLLPEELQGYHTLVPLEPIAGDRRKLGNWYSTVYRALNAKDGVPYALRRVENYRLMNTGAFTAVDSWSRVRHPNIVSVREAFTTRAFNDSSLVVVYDYHPNAETLFDVYFKPKAPTFENGRVQQREKNLISEGTLWSYIVQIANAIQVVHDAGMAVRVVDATKILVTGKNRVRVGACGLIDILMYATRQDLSILQQEDLTMFGKLVLALCCNNMAALSNLPKALELLSRNYSSDVKNVALYLVSKPGSHKNIHHLLDMMGSRILTEMDETQNSVDRLEAELMSELENARLIRLLCKFGFINERPEFGRAPRWSETGDRYIVKLFRDYVFHQVDEQGEPVVNLTHVFTCLNKLDAGSEERIMLVARDEQSCLVVSFKEVKACIDSAFSELTRKGTR